jgi:hypothetical protein
VVFAWRQSSVIGQETILGIAPPCLDGCVLPKLKFWGAPNPQDVGRFRRLESNGSANPHAEARGYEQPRVSDPSGRKRRSRLGAGLVWENPRLKPWAHTPSCAPWVPEWVAGCAGRFPRLKTRGSQGEAAPRLSTAGHRGPSLRPEGWALWVGLRPVLGGCDSCSRRAITVFWVGPRVEPGVTVWGRAGGCLGTAQVMHLPLPLLQEPEGGALDSKAGVGGMPVSWARPSPPMCRLSPE